MNKLNIRKRTKYVLFVIFGYAYIFISILTLYSFIPFVSLGYLARNYYFDPSQDKKYKETIVVENPC